MGTFGKRRVVLLSVAVLGLGACAQDGTPSNTGIGAGTGAVVGGVLGNVLSAPGRRSENTAIGAAVGAALGGAVGFGLDRQQRQYEQALAAERARNDVQISRLQDDLLRLTLASDVQFATGSAVVQPGLRRTLDKIANVLNQSPSTRITVVGHTDSTGSEQFNQELSLRRAEAVRNELVAAGVSPNRMFPIGRGESEPVATNATAEGRAANRRVDLLLQEARA